MAGRQTQPGILLVCTFCKAAGIIPDREDPTIGIVCVSCSGTGCRPFLLEQFTERRTVKGIKRVRRSGTGLSPFSARRHKPKTITYNDFLKGKLP